MNVTVINKSTWSDEAIGAIVGFLAPCFGDAKKVQVTFRSRPRRGGSWGNCRWPVLYDRRGVKKGVTAIVVFIGRPLTTYPNHFMYKKTAGESVTNNLIEDVVHVLAHELRHAEQFAAAKLVAEEKRHGGGMPLEFGFKKWFRRFERSNYERGSCEVDAERVAIGLLKAYQTFVENNVRERAIKAFKELAA